MTNLAGRWLGIVGLIASAAAASSAHAVTSNRDEIRRELSQGYNVVWGHNFTEGDWYEGSQAVAASIATDNPGPFMAWFDYKLEQNIVKMQSNLPGVATNVIKDWIRQSLEKKRIITYNGVKIDAGFTTYQRWERVVYHEPQTYRCKINGPFGSWTWGVCTTSVQKERRLYLNNHHQFYVRFQLVNDVPSDTNNFHRVYFENKCDCPVYVGVNYLTLNNAWTTQGFYLVQPGRSTYLFNTANNIFEYTAFSSDGEFSWRGDYGRTLYGKNYKFKRMDIQQSRYVRWTQTLTCARHYSSSMSTDSDGNVRAADDGSESPIDESGSAGDGWDDGAGSGASGDGWDSTNSQYDTWGVESAPAQVDWGSVEEQDYSGLSGWDPVSELQREAGPPEASEGSDDGWD